MNWEAIGAIGEVAGAVAVVATLLYLARQTTTNTKAVLAQTAREVDLYFANWHQALAGDPELRRISEKGAESTMPEFTESEWFEFRLHAISLMLPIQAEYFQSELGIARREHTHLYFRIAKGMLQDFPAWRKFWEEEQEAGTFEPGFFEAVNAWTEGSSFDHIAREGDPPPASRVGGTPGA